MLSQSCATLGRDFPTQLTMETSTSFNASQYPRTYRLSIGWMAFMLLFGLGATWVGAYGAWNLVIASLAHHDGALTPR